MTEIVGRLLTALGIMLVIYFILKWIIELLETIWRE
jgi:hypothetical protein